MPPVLPTESYLPIFTTATDIFTITAETIAITMLQDTDSVMAWDSLIDPVSPDPKGKLGGPGGHKRAAR